VWIRRNGGENQIRKKGRTVSEHEALAFQTRRGRGRRRNFQETTSSETYAPVCLRNLRCEWQKKKNEEETASGRTGGHGDWDNKAGKKRKRCEFHSKLPTLESREKKEKGKGVWGGGKITKKRKGCFFGSQLGGVNGMTLPKTRKRLVHTGGGGVKDSGRRKYSKV